MEITVMETQSAVETLINPQATSSSSDTYDRIRENFLLGNFSVVMTDSETLDEEENRSLAESRSEPEMGIASISSTQTTFNFQNLTANVGRGFGNPDNRYSWSILEYNGELFVGTLNYEGGEIWKTSLSGEPQWEQVLDLGPEVLGFREMIEFQGAIYAFTTSEFEGAVGVGSLTEPSAWVSSDGIDWTEIDPFPVNNPSNSSIRTAIVHNDLLYVGTFASDGGEIFTFDGSDWELVKKFSSDFPAVSDLVKFGDQLYAGTLSLTPSGNFFTNPSYLWTGPNFDTDVTPSFRFPRRWNGNNDGVMDAAVFNDELYISTANLINGFSVFRSSDPLTGDWEVVTNNGFGDRDNAYGWDFAVYDDPSTDGDDQLFLSNFNSGFYDFNGTLFDGEAVLYSTTNGESWEEVSLPDFGPETYGIREVLVTSNEQLVLGTATNATISAGSEGLGTQVWIADFTG